jgi:Tfp pilus assembly protein PilF
MSKQSPKIPPPPEPATPARQDPMRILGRPLVAGPLLVVITLVAYAPALFRGGFVWDDFIMLVGNAAIKAPDGLDYIWGSTLLPDYFPLTSTSLWLEWRLWGMNAFGYHLTNLLLHAGGAVLFWRGLRLLQVPGAWLAALIFAVHPVNVESAAWIAERKNTLTLFFYALAFWSYQRFESEPPAAAPGPARSKWYWLALAAFVLSLLSKTAAVTFPGVLLLCAWWRRGKVTWRDVWQTLPFGAVAAGLSLITIWFQYHRAIGGDVVQTAGFAGRLATAGWAVWFYLYKAVLPLNLIFIYPRWNIDPHSIGAWLPLAALTGCLGVFWSQRRNWGRTPLFALGYFLMMLFPVAGFFNIYFQRYSLVADHWQYFSLIGVIALAVAAGDRLARKLNAVVAGRVLGAAVVIVFSTLTWRQCGIYHDEETLWRDTLAKDPACWLAHNNLGMILRNQGKRADAEAQYRTALAIKPDFELALNNLGVLLIDEGRNAEAEAALTQAIRVKPGYADAHNNLGIVLARQGEFDEAMEHFRLGLRYKADNPIAHNSLANILVLRRLFAEAVPEYEAALELKPDYAEAHNGLGCALAGLGRLDKAVTEYREALRLSPSYAQAHFNLGCTLLQLHQSSEAVFQFKETLRLQPDYPEAQAKLHEASLLAHELD